jgi:hypothetical protein
MNHTVLNCNYTERQNEIAELKIMYVHVIWWYNLWKSSLHLKYYNTLKKSNENKTEPAKQNKYFSAEQFFTNVLNKNAFWMLFYFVSQVTLNLMQDLNRVKRVHEVELGIKMLPSSIPSHHLIYSEMQNPKFCLPSFVIVMLYYLVISLNMQKLPLHCRGPNIFRPNSQKKCEKFNLYDFCHSPKKLAAVSPFSVNVVIYLLLLYYLVN